MEILSFQQIRSKLIFFSYCMGRWPMNLGGYNRRRSIEEIEILHSADF